MIDTNQKLTAFMPILGTAQWIALDTEADSLHAYPEKLCLLQLSFDGVDALLDPLAGMDLTPVLAELRRHELIMHGADYDLRLLRRHCDFSPSAIFDTMIASRLLGHRQFGLDSLTQRYLGVALEKGPQKANWARRPLTPRMETYARNDTHYLKSLADILSAELSAKGRLEWHRESCHQLIQESARLRPVDPDQQWRVKGSSGLAPAGLAVLREIWHWREREAIAANKPPYFILTPERMVALSEAATAARPCDDMMPRSFSPRRREGLLKAIQRGLQSPKPPQPLHHRGRRQSEAERRRLRELDRRRNQRAAELGIDPSLIASRAMLVLLSQNWESCQHELMRWQRDLLTH